MHPDLRGEAAALDAVWERIGATVASLLTLNDDAQALAEATAFLSAFGHAVVGWIWLDKAVLCSDELAKAAVYGRDFYHGKLRACRWFFEAEVPRIPVWLAQVDRLSDTVTGMTVEQF